MFLVVALTCLMEAEHVPLVPIFRVDSHQVLVVPCDMLTSAVFEVLTASVEHLSGLLAVIVDM